MDNNGKKERLQNAYDYLYQTGQVHSITELAEKLGRSRPSVSRALNGSPMYLNDKFLKVFANAFEMISLKWLLSGDGDMFTYWTPEGCIEAPSLGKSYHNGKPYYNVDFALGFDILTNDQTSNPDYLIDFPPYNDCDCYCNTHGNSMYPTIASGDIVALKIISDFSYLINGEIYGIVTTNGLRTIKRVRDNGDTFTLIADNPNVAEQTIPKSVVSHVFLVKGLIKQF